MSILAPNEAKMHDASVRWAKADKANAFTHATGSHDTVILACFCDLVQIDQNRILYHETCK